MKFFFKSKLTSFLLLIVIPGLIIAQDDIQTRTVKFSPGKSSTTINSSLKGRQTIDYVVSASEGQEMKVTLNTKNGANYFNVLPPGSTGEAIFIGSTEGNNYSGTLSSSGAYKIRVYLMSSAARRNESAKFTLTISVTGGSTAKQGDALVPGTKFNATSIIDAALTPDVAIGSTKADLGVIRYGNGDAEIHITNAKKQQRVFRFSKGEFTCTFPEGWKVETARNNSDEWIVSVNGQEFYKIPDAVIVGG